LESNLKSENKFMRKGKVLASLVALGVVLSAPLVAQAKKPPPPGKEKQPNGLPGLEDRLELNEGENNWAVVNGDTGAIVRSFSAAGPVTTGSPAHTAGSGLYDIKFTQDVSACAYEATLGDVGTGTPPVGQIAVSGDATDVHSVVVQTSNSVGLAADASFHLYVSCPGHTGD
jgi:hypothetical protein